MSEEECLDRLNDLILDRRSFLINEKDSSYNEVFKKDIEALEFAIDFIENVKDYIEDEKETIIRLIEENEKLKSLL